MPQVIELSIIRGRLDGVLADCQLCGYPIPKRNTLCFENKTTHKFICLACAKVIARCVLMEALDIEFS